MNNICVSANCCKCNTVTHICTDATGQAVIVQHSRAQISNQRLDGGIGTAGLLVIIDCIILQLLQNLQAVVDVVDVSQLGG